MESGHADEGIWQVPFVPAPASAHLPLELLTFAQLRAMDSAGRRGAAQRPTFHVLALVEAGCGTHRADFVNHPLRPRTVVHLRPGVVHRWSDVDRVEGLLVLFTPTATDVELISAGEASGTHQPADDEWNLIRAAAAHLQAEWAYALQSPATPISGVLRHTLTALVLRADAGAPEMTSAHRHPIFRAYRTAIEQHFRQWRHVAEYASALGYSPRTLSRATLSAAGVSAKQFLDERVTLEAKRLLTHTEMTVAQCAHALGFSQAANFTTFFVNHTGQPPNQWRDTERDSPDGNGRHER